MILNGGKNKREIALSNLYKGYKDLNKKPEEYIEQIWFTLPEKNTLFNFEKVSKRTHLDIASVNSAINISIENKGLNEQVAGFILEEFDENGKIDNVIILKNENLTGRQPNTVKI